MNAISFTFRDQTLLALPSGGLYWPAEKLLCVSDLHFGKSDRIARRSGSMLPPYETLDTLERLRHDIETTDARAVVCLGDSFDDLAAGRDLAEPLKDQILGLMAARRWIWIEGNHDPGPLEFGGTHQVDLTLAPFVFRHIAAPNPQGEISGHFHPKARLSVRGRVLSRRCLLVGSQRIIMPAYGTYTGGLFCDAPELTKLMDEGARAILLGPKPVCVPYSSLVYSEKPAARNASR